MPKPIIPRGAFKTTLKVSKPPRPPTKPVTNRLTRRDLPTLLTNSTPETTTTTPQITNLTHITSYNWLATKTPTIAVPGCPARWNPPPASGPPDRVQKDTGLLFISQNAARWPEYPLEPLFRALLLEKPEFDLRGVDVVIDRSCVRRLLAFVDPRLKGAKGGGFVFGVDVVGGGGGTSGGNSSGGNSSGGGDGGNGSKGTALFSREDFRPTEYVRQGEFKGFGHRFEKTWTAETIPGSTGHHRVISYMFAGMRFLLRHEVDAFLDDDGGGGGDGDSEGMPMPMPAVSADVDVDDSASPSPSPSTDASSDSSSNPDHTNTNPSTPPTEQPHLKTIQKGHQVPSNTLLEIKTRRSKNRLPFAHVAPQLWAAQTTKLVRAYHEDGVFVPGRVHVMDVGWEVREWERRHQGQLALFAGVVRWVVDAVRRECGGVGWVRFDEGRDVLEVVKAGGEGRLLPRDLYALWDG